MEAVKRERYICIQEFMVRDLGLKGNELIVYALLYGFTQDGEQYFSGSLNYIADWINASKTTAQNIIKSLMEKGFLVKRENYVNNVKFCEYRAAVPDARGAEPGQEYGQEPDGGELDGIPKIGTGCTKNWYGGVQEIGTGCTKNWYGGIPKIGTNNNIYNTNNKLDNNKYILSGKPDDTQGSPPEDVPEEIHKKTERSKPKDHPEKIRQIVDYFNKVCGTSYKYRTEATARLINARLNEGFTVEDFFKVIDKKHAEWHNDSEWCKYLRPETLFRPSHFESYLNQRSAPAAGGYAGRFTQEENDLYDAVVIR